MKDKFCHICPIVGDISEKFNGRFVERKFGAFQKSHGDEHRDSTTLYLGGSMQFAVRFFSFAKNE